VVLLVGTDIKDCVPIVVEHNVLVSILVQYLSAAACLVLNKRQIARKVKGCMLAVGNVYDPDLLGIRRWVIYLHLAPKSFSIPGFI
jgi:hypothetical protein